MGRSNKNKSKLAVCKKIDNKDKVDNKKLQKALASDLENGTNEEERMQELLDLIKNDNYDEDIICTLATISGFVLESKGIDLFSKLNGVKQISSCILHSNVEIREKTLGVMSNFLMTGGDGVIENIHSSSFITNLTQLLLQSSKLMDFSCEVVSKENYQKEISVLKQVLELFMCLCEASTVLVDSMDIQILFPVLLTIIINKTLEYDLRCVAANCLYTLSEENKNLTNLVVNYQDLLRGLLDIVTNNTSLTMLLSILCSGILINISPALPSHHASEVKENSIKLASCCLDLNLISTILKDEKKCSEVVNLSYLRIQDVALEILTNMLCTEEDDQSSWEDMDEEVDQFLSAEEESADNSNMRLLEVMVNNEIPVKVVGMCQAYNELAGLSNEKFLQILNNTRSRCWQYLSNYVAIAPLDVLGGIDHVKMLWLLLKNTLLNDQGNIQRNCEIMDATCSAMRSLALKLIQCDSSKVCCEEVFTMIALMLKLEISVSGKMNLVNVLGIIGKELCNSDTAIDILMKIGETLNNLLCDTNSTLLLKAEVVDASVDTFADGPLVDIILQSSKLLENLKNFSNGFKAQIKYQRAALGDNIGIVNMARINLIRFLSYKESNR
ncbi:uncharacterized protein LOC136072090 [Hydra vulgaris]|uniref:Uncharacterized protein LOC136072090 n=1 Tax=Hydra vulgaris TaxID=6087 RepID=A0ABM4DPD6_HYDVU